MLTSRKIIDYISKNRQASGKELSEYLSITPRAVRKQLRSLLDKGLVRKIGHPPKVYYLLETDKELLDTGKADKQIQYFINERYLFISPAGE